MRFSDVQIDGLRWLTQETKVPMSELVRLCVDRMIEVAYDLKPLDYQSLSKAMGGR